MSNYIDNLIARNLNAAEVVRPRLPSIFEPPPAAARGALSSFNYTEPVEAPIGAVEESSPGPHQTSRTEANQAMASRDRQPTIHDPSRFVARITYEPAAEAPPSVWRGIQQSPVIHETTNEASGSLPTTTSSVEPPSFTARVNEARVDQHRFTEATRLNANTSENDTRNVRQPNRDANREIDASSPRPVSTPADAAEDAETRRNTSFQANVKPSAVPQPNRQAPLLTSAHERTALPVSEAIKNAVSPIEPSARRVVVQPRVTLLDENHTSRESLRSDHQRQLFQSAEATPAPTINVTIGRLEVKALPPAAVPSRQPKPASAPLMSLDEYLRRRNNGGDSR